MVEEPDPDKFVTLNLIIVFVLWFVRYGISQVFGSSMSFKVIAFGNVKVWSDILRIEL